MKAIIILAVLVSVAVAYPQNPSGNAWGQWGQWGQGQDQEQNQPEQPQQPQQPEQPQPTSQEGKKAKDTNNVVNKIDSTVGSAIVSVGGNVFYKIKFADAGNKAVQKPRTESD